MSIKTSHLIISHLLIKQYILLGTDAKILSDLCHIFADVTAFNKRTAGRRSDVSSQHVTEEHNIQT